MKKTTPKTSNNTKKASKVSKNDQFPEELVKNRGWHEFYNYEANELFPSKESFRQRVAYTILKWSETDEALDLGQFFMVYKIPRETFRAWCAKYPDIKQAYLDAKLNVATRRRLGALNKQFEKEVVFKDMHTYDSDYLEINQYHASLRKDEDKQPHVFNVILDRPEVTSKAEMDYITSQIGKE